MSSNVRPRSRSSAAMRIASSSDVVVREVAKRKWSTSSSPRNIPKWLWVLPTSMVRSTRELSESSEAAYPLVLDFLERGGKRVALRGIQFEKRFEDEAALLNVGVRDAVVGRVDARALHDQDVDVDRSRRVPLRVRVAAEVQLDLLRRREQLIRVDVCLDLDTGV